MKNTISLKEYIDKLKGEGKFIIPEYQRGYIWGQYNPNHTSENGTDSVSFLINSILKGYPEKDIFLQGITAHSNESSKDITLVDGQQRTTFFFLLLKFLGYKEYITINYAVREKSDKFLEKLNIDNCEEDENEEFQDIYFFKKTIRIFNDKLKDIDKEVLREYILEHIRFLYIEIPENKAKLVFSMMNGNKAIMLQEELIKSELLRCSSINTEHIKEAENISIRSRFAREWDKWLHWWNDEDVKKFFKCDKQLGWLLPLIEESENVTFEQFKEKCLKSGNVKEAKEIFRKMRLLQKSIEDAYTNPLTYNYIGAILCIRRDKSEQYDFLKWYFDLVRKEEEEHEQVQKKLKRYFDWSFINLTHKEIVDNNKEKRDAFYDVLTKDDIYKGKIDADYNDAASWLLRCNILEDCSQNNQKGRKFNFYIWSNRSLEHIYPKSKVGHKDENGIECDYENKPLTDEQKKKITLWREDIKYNDGGTEYVASEHSIGNLVLLYKRDNSAFNAADFEQKKNMYFTINDDSGFQSRHLIHTVSVFANSSWGGEDIAKHKKQEIERFTNDYPEVL